MPVHWSALPGTAKAQVRLVEHMVKPITLKVKHLTNTSGGYLWVLIMVHILHLSFGLIYMVVNLLRMQRGSITSEDNVQLQTLGTYWHFLGGLWIVLFFILFSV